jgi:hypothetical protein
MSEHKPSSSNVINDYHNAPSKSRRVWAGILLYLQNWFLLIDCAFNCLFGGDPFETFSSRCGKEKLKGDKGTICSFVCRLLDKVDSDHCRKAVDRYVGEGSYRNRELW